jgi:DNA-binding transcriptional ArsR family regulator
LKRPGRSVEVVLPDVAALGALVGDRTRAALLTALLDGGPTSASALAVAAGASPSLASAHLRKLLEGGLVVVEARGRQRLYRLASVEVAELLETMQVLAPSQPVTSLRGANTKKRLRRARLCYDHLAGVLGTAVTDALVRRAALRDDLSLGPSAAVVLAEASVSVDALAAGSRTLARSCTDWTERRPHLAGALGAAVASACLERAWVVRRTGSRGLEVTLDGADGLEAWLGLRVRDVEGWAESA